MEEQPQDSADDKPPVFKNINGWIGGITGVVLALAGLRAAYQQLMPEKAPVENAAAATNSEMAVPSGEEAAAEDDGPWSYTTDAGGTLAWSDGLWVETDADGTVTNFHPLSREEGMTYASDPATGLFLRWRDEGGAVEQSEDNRVTWTDRYKVTPDEGEAPAEGEQPAT